MSENQYILSKEVLLAFDKLQRGLGIKIQTDILKAIELGGADYKGAWDNATQYSKNDIVEHSGSTWIAKDELNIGDEPGVAGVWGTLGGGGGGGGNDYKGVTLVTNPVTPTNLTEAESGNIVASFATPVTAVLPNAPANGTWYTLVAGNGTVFTITSTQPMVHPPGSDLGGLTTTVLSNGQTITAIYFTAANLWILFPESEASRWDVAAGPYQMGELVHPEASPPFTWYRARRAVPVGTDPTDVGNVQYWIRLESPSVTQSSYCPEVGAASAATIPAFLINTGEVVPVMTYTPSTSPGAANDTNYVTISVDFYPTGGGGSTNLSTMNSTTAGQIGGATALIPLTFVTGGPFTAPEPGTIVFTVTQTNAGLLLPSGSFTINVLGQVRP